MPAIIDSAPDCIVHISGAKPPDDSADFILQAAYLKCQGIMTFGPGSTYGEDGTGVAWAKREDRRRIAADEPNGIEEVLGRARDHR